MPRDVGKYLYDIRAACERITAFTRGMTFEAYRESALVQSAVERQFEIVGEALRHAIAASPALADAITHSRDIIAFRNRLIHGYANVSHTLVWGVVERDVPTRLAEVNAMLGGGGTP